MIMLIFWSVHKNLMLDRFFSDQMAPPLHLLISPRHAEYLGKWGKSIPALSATKNCLNYLCRIENEVALCMTIVIQNKVVLRDNQSSTSKELYLMIQFFTLSAPLRWFFSNSVPIQSELIHSVKSLIEKATTSASSRASQIGSQQTEKKKCLQTNSSWNGESSGNKKRLP